MSLIDLASLVLAPTATKEGKVYSAIPDTGEGDMTFTRASSATRVNSAGLIEKERANLLLQSNTFDTTWITSSVSVTGGQSGYDGTSDAWLLSKSGANGFLYQIISNSGVQNFSIYAKSGSLDFIRFRISSGSTQSAYFDLSNGLVGSTSADIESKIESIGNGWYRCSTSLSDSVTQIRIYPADDDNDTSGTSGNILIQDAMLNEGLVAQPYIETTTTAVYEGITDDVPRVDYSGGGCPSLLLEGQRTNLITQSEYSGDWTYSNGTGEDNQTISPEGVQNAMQFIPTASGANVRQTTTISIGQTYTASLFVKYDGLQFFQLDVSNSIFSDCNLTVDLSNGTIDSRGGDNIDDGIIDYGNGWYRIYMVMEAVGGGSAAFIMRNWSGFDGSNGFYLWGAMLEEGSYSTSYIPTYGTSTTRVADSCSKTGISELIGQTEGTLFLNLLAIESEGSEFYQASFSDGSNNEAAIFGFTNTSGQLRFRLENGGVAQCQIYANSIDTSTYVKAAIAYKENDFAFYVNGVQAGTDTSGSVPSSLTQFHFANGANTSTQMYGNIKEVVFFPTRLTNDELAELTKL